MRIKDLDFSKGEAVKGGISSLLFPSAHATYCKIKSHMVASGCGAKDKVTSAQCDKIKAGCKDKNLVSQDISNEDMDKVMCEIQKCWDDLDEESDPEPEMGKQGAEVQASLEPSEVQRLSDILLYRFRPVLGTFTVGHSLAQIGAKNVNGDVIPFELADYFCESLVGQVSTWQHDQTKYIGTILDATLDSRTGIVLCNTRFWEARPFVRPLVKQVRDSYNMGVLKFSYEIYSFEVECSECHQVFETLVNKKHDHYCEHLKSRKMPGSPVSRIHRQFVVSGEGVVANPAYRESQTFVAASENFENNDELEILERLNNINRKLKLS